MLFKVHVLEELFINSNIDEIQNASYLVLCDLINQVAIGGTNIYETDNDHMQLSEIKTKLLEKFNTEEVSESSDEIENLSPSVTNNYQNEIIGDTQINQPQQVQDNLLARSGSRLARAQNLNPQKNQQQQHQQQQQLQLQQQQQQQQTLSLPVINNHNNTININEFFDQIRIIAREECNKANSSLSENNLPKKLTVNALNDLRETIYRKYEKLLKTENTIAVFKTHKENNTVPGAINYNRFPKPLWSNDQIFIDNYNNIIRMAQAQIIDSFIDHGKIIIDSLNQELGELRSKLDVTYNGINFIFREY